MLSLALLAACSTPPAPPPDPTPDAAPEQGREPAAAAARSQLLRLPNGMSAFVQIGPRGSAARLQFGVLAGSLFVAPGLAELAARTLLQSTDPTTGTASLEQRIRQMGGTIEANVGLTTTWFDIRIRAGMAERALIALRESLQTVTDSRTQITRMREQLVAERTAEILADPLDAAARALLHAERSTADQLNGLLDLDPSEVALFHSRLYRPERSVLAVRVPFPLERALRCVTEPADQSIAGWTPPPPMPGDSPVMPRQFESGLYWTEVNTQGGKTRCAFVMRLPDMSMPGAAEWLVMQSCLTLGGAGGRLEQLQDEAGLSHLRWQASVERTPDVLALVIETIATPDEVTRLWSLYQRARQSLVEVPPSTSELRLALRRARLDAGLPRTDTGDDLRLDANLVLRNVRPDALDRRLEVLADPAAWDPTSAAQAFLATPAWMVAMGPGRPAELEGLVATEMLPTGFDPNTQNQPTPEVIANVDPWLVRARAATGGEQAYRALDGFAAKARVVTEQGLIAEDEWTWSRAGKLTRSRTVVGQTIRTEIDGDAAFEQFDDVRKSLSRREAVLLRHEMMRHPQMLLAAHQRGERRFRPIAQRKQGDREYFIVECIGDEFDRLRMHIDAESHLVRTVESWERLPDDTLVYVREEWSDYRNAGGLRVPHRRRTTWNDGQHASETTFSAWTPKLGAR
ncbi:MAG: insulinase family protein [Planctomycetes bacterium]|nr:insulinase family protein [Planctomycetota bacterium]